MKTYTKAERVTIAYAAGADAANRRMRKAGRAAWNMADYNVACRVTAKLTPLLESEHVTRAAGRA